MGVLVAYATDHGSTRGIAERIGRVLDAGGLSAEVTPIDAVSEVRSYSAFVLGSCIHGGKWLAGASEFVRVNAAALAARPVWLFSVSCVGDEDSTFPARIAAGMRAMRKETKEMTELRAAVGARGHHNFTGAIQPDDWDTAGRAFFRLVRGTYGDHRNWPAIDAWAEHIASELGSRPAPIMHR